MKYFVKTLVTDDIDEIMEIILGDVELDAGRIESHLLASAPYHRAEVVFPSI